MEFGALDLPPEVMRGVREAGFVTTTPIQEAALPLALRGKDVAGQSQTGTGKTAAFLIAAFTRLLRTPASAPAAAGSAPRVLIIAPTRELTVQIESEIDLDPHYYERGVAARRQARDSLDGLADVFDEIEDLLSSQRLAPRKIETSSP